MEPAKFDAAAIASSGGPAECRRAGAAEKLRQAALIAGLLLVNAAIWTYIGTRTHGVIHHDMAEAWAWGHEFQLGYWKHPPLFAWVAGLWFGVMPRENEWFFLLSALNGAVGLAGAWAVAGRLLPRSSQWAALFLLLLTPFYGAFALKFNANTILLSVWPWAAYFFIRSLETRSALHGGLFGLFIGLALLGKYYSVLLLLSCVAAALLHPRVSEIFRSPAPYVAAAVCALVILPHTIWVVEGGFQTVQYAITKTQHSAPRVLVRGAAAALLVVAFHSLAILALIMAFRRIRRTLPARVLSAARERGNWWLVALAVGPFALTLLACIAANVRISAEFMIPIFFLVPTAVLVLGRLYVTAPRLRTLALGAAALTGAVGLAAEPVGKLTRTMGAETWREPTREVALDATKLWRWAFGKKLEIVSGEDRYAHAATFYSPDAPHELTNLDFRLAPWIARDQVDKSGMLILCPAEKTSCLESAAAYEKKGSFRVARSYRPKSGGVRKLVIVLIPPVGASGPAALDD